MVSCPFLQGRMYAEIAVAPLGVIVLSVCVGEAARDRGWEETPVPLLFYYLTALVVLVTLIAIWQLGTVLLSQ
jgi:hypothetical protein